MQEKFYLQAKQADSKYKGHIGDPNTSDPSKIDKKVELQSKQTYIKYF